LIALQGDAHIGKEKLTKSRLCYCSEHR
jgi:hypothetical protein